LTLNWSKKNTCNRLHKHKKKIQIKNKISQKIHKKNYILKNILYFNVRYVIFIAKNQ